MIGIDEVGRGCWAGPLLVVAARQTGLLPSGLADSKVLTKKRRQSLYFDIQLNCELGEGWVQPTEIDKLGLTGAMKLGVERALLALRPLADEEIIIDGNINYCPPQYRHVQAIVDADADLPLVSAASVYAKVTRDKYMANLGIEYTAYQFGKHVGYGTKLHREMLQHYGVSDIHRLSYKPVQAFIRQPL